MPPKKLVKGKNGLYPGEKHGILNTPKGLVRANFAGPGTKLELRLDAGDKGKTVVDKISKAHDIRYALASNEAQVNIADQKMIKAVDKAWKNKTDNKFNLAQGQLIKVKQALRKVGLKTRHFGASFGDIPINKKPLYLRELKKLEQQGYGHGKPKTKIKKR
jgi:hypothetical protein